MTFQDYKENKLRKENDEFIVSVERFEELNKAGQKYSGKDWVKIIRK